MDGFKALTQERALVFPTPDTPIIGSGGADAPWLFDFRSVMLDPEWLDFYAELFWEKYGEHYPFQVCGMETAGIPLVAAIVMKGKERGTPVGGLFVRKSRKKEGLMKMVEGTPNVHPVILVDDLINYGRTVHRQMLALADLDVRVSDVFVLVAFRAAEAYDGLKERGVRLQSLFTLEDFGLPLLSPTPKREFKQPLRTRWRFSAPRPSRHHVVEKSAPLFYNERIFFGSDAGVFYALDAETGDICWTFASGSHPKGKGIFSSPDAHDGLVFFGAYDGNVYALKAQDGAKAWEYRGAEWIGSSPALAPGLGLLFIGLESGLPGKRGGIAALHMDSGEESWRYDTPEFTHSSPLYIARESAVVIGSNDHKVYCHDARTGTLRWSADAGGEVKSSLAYDAKRRLVLFGSFDHSLHALRIKDGSPSFSFMTGSVLFSTPLVSNDTVYVASLDKNLYAVNLKTGVETWRHETGGRIFATPTLAFESLWIGSNDGRLYELDPANGSVRSSQQFSERIVNAIATDELSGRLFVPTQANEIYCMERSHAHIWMRNP